MTNTPVEALSAINVGVIKEEGRLEATITLEEFLRVAKSQHICAHTNARGEINFDLTISNTDNIIDKVKEWREQQEKKIGSGWGGSVFVGQQVVPGSGQSSL